MADARLRELARFEHADRESQLRLLRERMRAGALSEERVRLAAHLGDEVALRLIAIERPPAAARGLLSRVRAFVTKGRDNAVEDWVRTLTAFGGEALLRAAVGTAAHVLPVFLREAPDHTAAPELLWAVEAWTAHPSEESKRRVARCWDEVEAEAGRWDWPPDHTAAGPAAYRAMLTLWPLDQENNLDQAEWTARHAARDWTTCHWRAPLERFQAVIQAELVPWALGLRDPVAERVAARTAWDPAP